MRTRLLVGAVLLSVLTPSCLGPNRALSSLSTWNAQLSTEDWINELVFLGLILVPVYPVAFTADIVIFNTMDYWRGENPINDPGPFPDTFHYEPAPKEPAPIGPEVEASPQEPELPAPEGESSTE